MVREFGSGYADVYSRRIRSMNRGSGPRYEDQVQGPRVAHTMRNEKRSSAVRDVRHPSSRPLRESGARKARENETENRGRSAWAAERNETVFIKETYEVTSTSLRRRHDVRASMQAAPTEEMTVVP